MSARPGVAGADTLEPLPLHAPKTALDTLSMQRAELLRHTHIWDTNITTNKRLWLVVFVLTTS